MIVAFRRHTLLPLDDRLYALQATTPHLTQVISLWRVRGSDTFTIGRQRFSRFRVEIGQRRGH
jgi:hypothetical protein